MRYLNLLAVAAVLPFSALAFQSDFNWSGPMIAGQTLQVKNVNGSVRAELAAVPNVEVTAHKSARRSDVSTVRIEVVPTSDGVTICTVYPGDDGTCENGRGHHSDRNDHDNDVTVDYVVKVPAGVKFSGHTVNGAMTVKGLRSDVNATNVNGNIKVDTTGLVRANTVNGSIEAVMGSANWSDSLSFTTVNGSIDLTMPASTNADVQASTVSGNLQSDFQLTVNGTFEPRNMHARIGAGGKALKLSTVNGAITLHQGS